jgi:hypothetical protein
LAGIPSERFTGEIVAAQMEHLAERIERSLHNTAISSWRGGAASTVGSLAEPVIKKIRTLACAGS